MHQLLIWKFIAKQLIGNHSVMLMCVVQSSGSSPGRQGFKMAVSENEMIGSIGGGIMEHKFVELAKENLQKGSSLSFVRKQFHQKSAVNDQSGMICSGEQSVLLYPFTEEDLPVIQKIISALENNNTGLIKITFSEIDFVELQNQQEDYSYRMQSETDFIYTERIGYKNHLYIIGGGHCALALSKLMSVMDFYIHLFEERDNLNTMIENNFVHEKKIVNDYSELSALIPDGSSHQVGRATPAGWNIYITVMTFGYRTDDIAVRALVNKKIRYLGVLGSESKMKKLFSAWGADGISEHWLSSIHAPIGVQIKSETPEEIAISIAAQIILTKNA